jgi:hypothetical protein
MVIPLTGRSYGALFNMSADSIKRPSRWDWCLVQDLSPREAKLAVQRKSSLVSILNRLSHLEEIFSQLKILKCKTGRHSAKPSDCSKTLK